MTPAENQYDLFCPADMVIRMLTHMTEMGFLTQEDSTNEELRYSISPRGWLRIQELSEVASESRQGFVAMWFSAQTDEFYKEGIEPAVKEAGFDCKLIKNVQHNNKIDDAIVAEIRKSRFVIADFTVWRCPKCENCEETKDCKNKVKVRGGVYFEAGFAQGLGLPVIWTVHKNCFDELHFDTRQYNHIVYGDPQDLREQLYNRIAATIH
jgi:hypothetical protein